MFCHASYDAFLLCACSIEHFRLAHIIAIIELNFLFGYLALGMYMQDVALEFRVGISTVSNIVHSTSKLLWRTLQPLYLEVCILHMQLVFMLQSHRTIIHTLCKLSTFSSHNQHLWVVFCSAR